MAESRMRVVYLEVDGDEAIRQSLYSIERLFEPRSSVSLPAPVGEAGGNLLPAPAETAASLPTPAPLTAIETKPVADAPASSERGILKNARRHEGTKARRHEGTKARRSPVEAAARRSRREKADAAPARAGGNEVLPEESFAMRSQKHL